MKANLKNLKKAMMICAKAHNAEFCDWSDEDQIAIKKECVPVFADVQNIGRAFFQPGTFEVEADWGYVNIFFGNEYLGEVNTMLLGMALPFGSLEKFDN